MTSSISSVFDFFPESATVLVTREVDSTSDVAKLLAKSVALPLVVLAESQRAGRGRGDKTWWTGENCVAFSLAIPLALTGIAREDIGSLSLRTGAVVIETLIDFLAENFSASEKSCGKLHAKNAREHWSLRFPNDILYDGKKLAGILIESPFPEVVVIGIGINTNTQTKFAPREILTRSIISLTDIFSCAINNELLIAAILQRLTAPQWGLSARVEVWYTAGDS